MRYMMPRAALLAVALVIVALPAAQAAPRPAPDFTLPLLTGQTLSLADLKGRAVILLFWAPW
jgi:cytochrome oxidase Cu insertion factor (SCO1/SenC/PrrC family)